LSDATGELSTYDNHPADVGTETYERARDLALEEKMSNDLAQVSQALELIDQGRYGTCQICGMDILFERLEAKRQYNHGKFDDADAWESVEEYGTFNSAAMATKRDVKDYQEGM